ncbi:MAG: membrane protein insertion efficiency factor YidD [Candidatus Omnitrophota bacterium]
MKRLAIFLIEFYRKLLSPNMLRTCRYYPTCSEYAKESIEQYGFLKGMVKTLWRILRCNPFARGGYDPVK